MNWWRSIRNVPEQLAEEHRKRTEELAQKRRSYRKACLERVVMQREQRRLQLEELAERAGLFHEG